MERERESERAREREREREAQARDVRLANLAESKPCQYDNTMSHRYGTQEKFEAGASRRPQLSPFTDALSSAARHAHHPAHSSTQRLKRKDFIHLKSPDRHTAAATKQLK